MTSSGLKLNCEPEGAVGRELLQFKAQHNRAARTCGVSVLFFAALQQGIIAILLSIFPECSSVPANTLPAKASNKNMDANRFIICDFNLL